MLLSEGIFSIKWDLYLWKSYRGDFVQLLVRCRFQRHTHLAEWFYISLMGGRGLCMLSNASSMIDAADIMNQAK